MHIPLLTLACILLTAYITAMEVPEQSKNIEIAEFPLLNCKEESAAIMTAIIAYSESKDALRKTCRRVCDIMLNREAILKHPLLRINETALSNFFSYYGTLNNTKIIRNLITKGVNKQINNQMYYELIHRAAQYGYSDVATMLLEQSTFNRESLIQHPKSIKHTPLFTAIKHNQSEMIKKFLSICSLAEKNHGEALSYAAEQGSCDAVHALINCKVNVHATGGIDRIEPFWWAARRNHIDIMKLLLDNGATVYCSRPEMFPFLTLSIQAKHLLHAHGFDIKINNTPEELILYYCAIGDCTMVQKLLSEGINPNMQDKESKRLIHYAAEYGYLDIVNVLLAHPRFVKTDIAEGHASPFYLAMNRGQHAVIKRILETCPVNVGEALCYAAKKKLLAVVNTLLACGVDPNSLNNEKLSALFCLAQEKSDNYLPVMQTLIAHGAAVSKGFTEYYRKSFVDVTPLHLTTMQHFAIQATQLLIDSGADINAKTSDGLTPLHTAVRKGESSVVEVLTSKGAHVDAQDNDGKTPLHYASEQGSFGIQGILLKNGAHINERDNAGNTPLHALMATLSDITNHNASSFYDILMEKYIAIQELVAHPYLIINAENHEGKTPLDLISFDNLRKELIDRGAKTHNQLLWESMQGDHCTIQ